METKVYEKYNFDKTRSSGTENNYMKNVILGCLQKHWN